jgi:hypothetical protein
VRLIEFTDGAKFSERVSTFLLAREAECCVELGLINRIVADDQTTVRGKALRPPLLWAVENQYTERSIVSVAMQTVTDRMIVTRGPAEAMHLLSRQLLQMAWKGKEINGVVPGIGELAAD